MQISYYTTTRQTTLIVAVIVLLILLIFFGRFLWNTMYFPYQLKNMQKAFERGEYENVLNTIDNLSNKRRKEPEVQWLIARIYYERSRYTEAMVYLKELLDSGNYPKEVSSLSIRKLLALIYEKTNQHKKAMEEYEEIAKMNESDYDAFFKVGTYYYTVQNHEKAKYFLERAIKLDSKDPDVRFMLAASCFNLKQHAQALTETESILALDSNHSKARLLRGKIKFLDKAFDEAREDLLVTYNISDCKMESAMFLGRIFYEEKDIDQAIQFFEDGLILNTNNDEETLYSRYVYADALVRDHRMNEALEQYRIIKNAKKTMLDVDEKIEVYSSILSKPVLHEAVEMDISSYLETHLYKILAKSGYAIVENEVISPALLYFITLKKIGGGTQSYRSAFAFDASCISVDVDAILKFSEYAKQRKGHNSFYISLAGFEQHVKPEDFDFPIDFIGPDRFERVAEGEEKI